MDFIIDDFGNKKEIVSVCSCGKPLVAKLDNKGKRIGVTHTANDEDWHYKYWSIGNVLNRQKNN